MISRTNYVLEELLDRYQNEDKLAVIKNLIPILWFGDMNRYVLSEMKIITVSLNPSNNEFGNIKKSIPYSTNYRFKDYNGTQKSLLIAYNNYFKTNPYSPWFKASFDTILSAFDASHYDNRMYNALHTDIGIPYATDPTWKGLSKEEKTYFAPIGQNIWHDLVGILEPDLILLSASGGFHERILFPKIHENWKVLIQKEKYPVLYNQVQINNKIIDVISQTQGRKPFLNLNKEEKLNLKNTLELFKNGKA